MKINVLTALEAASLDIERLEAPQRPTVISAQDAQRLTSARELLDTANALLETANTEMARTRAQAQKAGYKDGLQQAATVLLMAKEEHKALLHRSEAEIFSLALELTRRIVGHRLSTDPSLLSDMVAHTMSLAKEHHNIEVLVHPDDLHRIETTQIETAAQKAVIILEDEKVPRGGCWIHTQKGIIEADLDTQIEVLAQLMGVELWAGRQQ